MAGLASFALERWRQLESQSPGSRSVTPRDITQDYERTFTDMTAEIVPLPTLLAVREELLDRLQRDWTTTSALPDFTPAKQTRMELWGIAHFALLRGIRWKPQDFNQLETRDAQKFAEQAKTLQRKLGYGPEAVRSVGETTIFSL